MSSVPHPQSPASAPPTSPLALLGTWELSRRIEDRAAGETLHVAGSTVLRLREDERISWEEQGTLTRQDPHAPPIPVRRELLIEHRGADHVESGAELVEDWMVLFSDGRDFHPWTPGRQVVHPCGSDRYDGLVEIEDARTWHVTWEITGPAKDMRISSRLHRPENA